MKFVKKYSNLIYPLISLSILIGIWAIFASVVGIEIIVPSIKSTFVGLGEILSSAKFYSSALNTLLRAIIAFALAMVSAVIFSILSAFFPIIYKLLSPLIAIMRAVPTMSIILLTVVWMKPETSPILIAYIIIFPLMYAGIYSSVTGVDKDLVDMSRAYKVSKKDMIKSLYLPSIAPSFFDISKANISLTVKLIISAEIIAQTRFSLGIMMQIARSQLETAQLLAYTILAIVMSYLLELFVGLIKRLVVRWQYATK